ncbi:MAG: SAM-dependent methyltransferase [Verrucomicrobiota bacterium]
MKTADEFIRQEILRHHAISFARFMELALYSPETGYYEKPQGVGRRGDFITSVSVGSLFGGLLAFQFAEWLVELRIQGCPMRIMEAGAHDGKLAADVLTWLQVHRPRLCPEIEYIILEPSPVRRQWQRETLKGFAASVRWISHLDDPAVQGFRGVIFGNELLDAMPVHRLGWDARAKVWFEWGVALAGEKLVWVRMPDAGGDSRFAISAPLELLAVLPDGYAIEISTAAEKWWREAAGILTLGKLLTMDYGFTSGEQFSPSRINGTLRAYHQHRASDNLLMRPGEQDLTAHVNFSAMQNAGEEAGLKTEAFCPQPQFLTRILSAAVKSGDFASLDARQTRQFQALTHPEHLGRAFRVLIQSR